MYTVYTFFSLTLEGDAGTQTDSREELTVPNKVVLTKSPIKMRLLTWFYGYKLVSTRRTPRLSNIGAIKYSTEWRLAKRITR